MSLSTPDKTENNNSLSIPEILADFFLRKIDMPSYSDDSDHKHKSKRKKSKYKKRKHKKSRHRHGNDSSDSLSESPDLNSKAVDDVSSSEEMGIQRLKKIKSMKLQSVNKTVIQTVSLSGNHEIKNKSDMPNSSASKNLEFYGPSVDLLLSGTESNCPSEKIDANVSSEDHKNIDLECNLNKIENTSQNNNDLSTGKQNNILASDLFIALPVDSNDIKPKSVSSIQICDENHAVNDKKNDTHKSEIILDKICEIQKNCISDKIDLEQNCKNNDKCKSDAKHNTSHPIDKHKEKKRPRSHSRSKSRSRHRTPKSKHRRRKSRSSSRDSCHSHRKRKKHSRSHSQERLKSREYKRKSRSRSRSESKYGKHKKTTRSGSQSRSRSPRERCNRRRSRSRSRVNRRSRRRSDSRRRRRSYSRDHDRSLSKSRHKSKSRRRSTSHTRSRSKSKPRRASRSKEKSRSRSDSREKRSSSNKIDQAKILETARKNVLKMMKNGTLPEGLPVENLKKEQFISIQSGGKSVQELTDFCQRLSQKENEPEENEDKEDKPDEETGFIHHPFKVKEPGVIKLNIKNAVQLPIKTHAQKVAETARLSSQFPVSSGNQHKRKELEWIPVVPASTKPETKPVNTYVSTVPVNTNADSNKTVEPMLETPVLSAPSPVSSIPVPVTYPSSSSETPTVETPPIVPPLVTPPLPPPPLPPTLEPLMQLPPLLHMPVQSLVPSYIIPSEDIMNSYPTTSVVNLPSASVFKPPKKLDIPAIVAKRFQALTKLQQDPNDPDALKIMNDAHESIQEWVESQQVPGLFTGSTDAKMLTAAELCGPKYHKFRKDIFSHAPPVTEGKGMSLLKKMGWNPGEGLGKNKEGNVEPLMLDIKMDKKGLVSEGENSKKGANSFIKELQGKHPVSALMELCSKRRWKPPLYTCVYDHGPPHRKLFCFKVEVNGVEYQPLNPCSNKKVAKADAAVLCLQSLNILSKTV